MRLSRDADTERDQTQAESTNHGAAPVGSGVKLSDCSAFSSMEIV
jgi:hypothetical protein